MAPPGPVRPPAWPTTLDGCPGRREKLLARDRAGATARSTAHWTTNRAPIRDRAGGTGPAVPRPRVKSRVLVNRIGARLLGPSIKPSKRTCLPFGRSESPPARQTNLSVGGHHKIAESWFLYPLPRYAYAAGGLFICGADLVRLLTRARTRGS